MDTTIIRKAACNVDKMIDVCGKAKEDWENGLTFGLEAREKMIRFFEEYYKTKAGRKRITKGIPMVTDPQGRIRIICIGG